MDFLKKLDFEEEDILELTNNIPNLIMEKIVCGEKLVSANILYLKNLGVLNYKEVFSKYYEVFLLDHSAFVEVFEKYEKEDLIKYLKNNVDILEFL